MPQLGLEVRRLGYQVCVELATVAVGVDGALDELPGAGRDQSALDLEGLRLCGDLHAPHELGEGLPARLRRHHRLGLDGLTDG